jgi:uroporphyrinogen-III decarboxylase
MNAMTSQQRMFAALKGEPVDRTPMMEMFIDPKVIHGICPGMSYEDFIDYAEMDAVTCLTMADSPENINWIDKEQGIWLDKWGAKQILTEDVVSVITEPARITTCEELESYLPPDPMKSPVIGYAKKLVDRFKGKRAIAVVGEEVFAPSQYLRAGLANLMFDYVERPDFVKKLAKIGVEYHIELYRKLLKEGVEIVVLGDDYAGKNGTFMSPAHFEEFILPGLTAVVRAIKDAGGYVIKHTDGDVWKILDMLNSTGLDILGPLEQPYMRLSDVRRHSKSKVGVMGNVDMELLSWGTVQQVRQETLAVLNDMRGLGGHILSSGNTISSSVRPENFMTMIKTGKEYL